MCVHVLVYIVERNIIKELIVCVLLVENNLNTRYENVT